MDLYDDKTITDLMIAALDYKSPKRPPGRPPKRGVSISYDEMSTTNDTIANMLFVSLMNQAIKRCFTCIKQTEPRIINFTAESSGFTILYTGFYKCRTIYTHNPSSDIKVKYVCNEKISVGLDEKQLVKTTQKINDKCDHIKIYIICNDITDNFGIDYISNTKIVDTNLIGLLDSKSVSSSLLDEFDITKYPLKFEMGYKLFKQYFIDKVAISQDLTIIISKDSVGLQIKTVDLSNKVSFDDIPSINMVNKLTDSDAPILTTFRIEDIKSISNVIIRCNKLIIYVSDSNMLCVINEPTYNISHSIIIPSTKIRQSLEIS